MKIINSTHVNPFGGLNFVLEEFERQGIGNLLAQNLPKLPTQCKYSWKDILYSFWSIYFCGGDCIEDIGNNLKKSLQGVPYIQVPSPDRILDRFKELALSYDIFTVPRGKSIHQFSLNSYLNELSIKISKSLGILENGLTLDYDNTIIYTNKLDSKRTYKKEFGYCPGVATIGNTVVFIENRNGNSDAKTLQFETLTRMFKILKEQKISIKNFRADGASYQLDIVDLVQKHVSNFYLRSNINSTLAKVIASISDWEQVKVGNEQAYRGETIYTPFTNAAKKLKKQYKLKEYRLVVTKILRNDGQINLFTNEFFNYSAILTNDTSKTRDEIVTFYNQRGTAEKEFDILKNDFGWNHLPFSKIEQNTVFLIFTAICRNLYLFIIKLFSKKFDNLKSTFRVKKFIFRFISIPAKWTKTAREYKLRIYGNIHFKT